MRGVFAILLVIIGSVQAQVRSPFNSRPLEQDSSSNYAFIVGGHFYGSSKTNSGFPASTVLGGIENINAFQPDVILHTGDLFLNVKKDSANYRRSLFNKIEAPVFNAVGNHDLDGDHYGKYGPTYFSIDIGRDKIIVLDTELDNGDIKNEQFDFLQQCLKEASSVGSDNVFIVSHRPVWALGHPELDRLLKQNTRSLTGNNFGEAVHPLLTEYAADLNICWFAGSMGGSAPSSFLYHSADNIQYIITAIRDTRRDAVLGVRVYNGRVNFETIALGEVELLSLEEYDIGFWKSRVGKPKEFNLRLIPYLIKTTVTHRAFWSGAFSVLFLLLLFSFIKRRKSKA